ncbi:hypothetical protein F3Y22_tig00110858pilonHSYRG00168 [Hibiscus syriacus]|uniref:Uncharacterized protein n=1 Tax=Hibiscus syriacus TaxID=106335 RepID=A0A6A2ZJU8_HIBSY|nr:hypothetical protein F3Y22_tig00110858pilonHSYRG00168 [Hibiscus syriacus]
MWGAAGLLETSGEVIVALKRRQGGWNSLELWSGGWDVAIFENLWVMDFASGAIKEGVKGSSELNRESGISSNFQFSNLGMLGLPYWLSFPLGSAAGLSVDKLIIFNIQFVARGLLLIIGGGECGRILGEGVAQQWYDELDNLAFESELVIEDDNATMDTNFQDERIHFDCIVNTSPGTSEDDSVLNSSPIRGSITVDGESAGFDGLGLIRKAVDGKVVDWFALALLRSMFSLVCTKFSAPL